MNIKILAVGKIKEKYFIDAIAEYLKRLSGYCDLKIEEIPAQEIKDESLAEKYKQIEAEKMLKYLENKDVFVVTLEIGGKNLSSESFSEKMTEIINSGFNEIIFVIGGANGLADSILAKSDFALSFSKMTFTHQFARLILIEQIYRAFKIMKKEPYHR